jgi:multiple sugar transport system permease protein
VVMWIYDTAFSQMNIGLASAMSVVLVVVIAVISFVQYRVLRGGDEP